MWVSHLETEGIGPELTGSPLAPTSPGRALRHDLERWQGLEASGAGRSAADALMLWAAALEPANLPSALVQLGLASSEAAVDVELADGWPVGVTWDRTGALASMLRPGAKRFGVRAVVQLDPTLFVRLREYAVRDPRLVEALRAEATIAVKLGFMIHPDGRGANIGVLELAVSDTPFPTTGTDRPSWGPALLRELGGRVRRLAWQDTLEAVTSRLLDAATGTDPDRRLRARAVFAAFAKGPFSWGQLEPIDLGDVVLPAFGEHLVRGDRLGPSVLHSLLLVEQVLLEQPDVLIVDGLGAGFATPSRLARWVRKHVDGAQATLEQVVHLPGGGA